MRIRTYRASAAVLACAALLLSACDDATDSTNAGVENSATPTENVIAPVENDADGTESDGATHSESAGSEATSVNTATPSGSGTSTTAPTEQTRGGYFAIQAHTPDFDPVPGVAVSVLNTCPRDLPENASNTPPNQLGSGTTGADGTVMISVPVGCWAVNLDGHPAEFTPEPVGLMHGVVTEPDDTALIRLAFRHSEPRNTGKARLTVLHHDTGIPRPGTSVHLAPCGSDTPEVTTAVSDANGAISIDLPAGCWNAISVAEPNTADEVRGPSAFPVRVGEVHNGMIRVRPHGSQ